MTAVKVKTIESNPTVEKKKQIENEDKKCGMRMEDGCLSIFDQHWCVFCCSACDTDSEFFWGERFSRAFTKRGPCCLWAHVRIIPFFTDNKKKHTHTANTNRTK